MRENLFVFALCCFLPACSGTFGQSNKTATATDKKVGATRKAAPNPSGPRDNPFYVAWASFKPGSGADYQLSVKKDGVVTSLPLHYALSAVNGQEAVITLNFPANTTVRLPAKLDPKSQGKISVEGWPELLYQLPYLPLVTETSARQNVAANGRTYTCRCGETTLADNRIKQCFSSEVPGGLVKAEVAGEQNTDMQLLLVKSTVPE